MFVCVRACGRGDVHVCIRVCVYTDYLYTAGGAVEHMRVGRMQYILLFAMSIHALSSVCAYVLCVSLLCMSECVYVRACMHLD